MVLEYLFCGILVVMLCHINYLSRFGRNAKIIHFIGPVKPWQHRYVPDVDAVILSPGSYASQNVAYDYIKRWWQVYNSTVQVHGWVLTWIEVYGA